MDGTIQRARETISTGSTYLLESTFTISTLKVGVGPQLYFFYVRELKGFAEKDTPPVPQIPLFRHTLSTAIYCPIYCLLLPLLSHFVSFVTYRTGTEIEIHNPPAVTSTTKPLTGSKPIEIV